MGRGKKKDDGQKVAEQMERRKKNKKGKQPVSGSMLLSCGCTVYDLAMSGSVEGGLASGKFYNIIGDSHAGKSLLALTTIACAANDPRFDDYDIIYDDVEAASEFDVKHLFGKKTAKRILPPAYDSDGDPEYSAVIEDFTAFVSARIKEEKPFIYILDSLDSLTCADEVKKEDENNKKHMNGTATTGSYGMGIPKALSRFFRTNKKSVKALNSYVIIVSQTRDNIGAVGNAPRKTRSGGKALKFYSTIEAWLAVVKKNKDSKYGLIVSTQSRMKVTKSKLTGKIREADALIYYDYGIDNIGSMVDWLVSSKSWPKTGQSITARDLGYEKMTRKKLIRMIEDNGDEQRLKETVQEKWDEIENSLLQNSDRKQRFE